MQRPSFFQIAVLVMMTGFSYKQGHAAPPSCSVPAEWEVIITQNNDPVFIGQKKLNSWNRDSNKNFIDDQLEKMSSADIADIIVDLNVCLTPEVRRELFRRFGEIMYISKYMPIVMMRSTYANILEISKMPEVAMVEFSESLR